MAIRSITPRFSEEDFEELKTIKNRSGLSWEQFILIAARLLDSEYIDEIGKTSFDRLYRKQIIRFPPGPLE
jgi:hypothetical protein